MDFAQLARQRRSQKPGGLGSGEASFASVQLCPARVSTITVQWPQGIAVEIAIPLDEAMVVRLVQNLVAPCSR